MNLWIDIETYCDTPIKHGTHRYAEHAELLIAQFAWGGDPVRVLDFLREHEASASVLVATLERATKQRATITAHNVGFDRTVLDHLGYKTDPLAWRCTMAQALSHSLPAKLEHLCSALGVRDELSKIKGKDHIQLFCKPRPANSKVRRATHETHPQQWDEFLAYAERDVIAMRACVAKMPAWNYPARADELGYWRLDQTANNRGFRADIDFVNSAIRAAKKTGESNDALMREMTHEEVQTTRKRDALLKHILAEFGVELPDLQSSTLERRLADPELPPEVKQLIALRLESAKSSVYKYRAIANGVSKDGRVRGTLQYCGAGRTGRWSGRLFQPQNLPRPLRELKPYIEEGIAFTKADALDLWTRKPNQLLSTAVRGVILPSEGMRLAVADLANIEGRIAAWLAGEVWKLQAYRDYDAGTGPDLYVVAYSRSFGVPTDAVIADDKAGGVMRQVGKVQELALQFQGAAGALSSMAEVYGVDIPEEKKPSVVKAWRSAHPRMVSLWYALDRAAIHAIQHPGERVTVEGCAHVVMRRSGTWLQIRLPSGRILCYPGSALDEDGQASYMGVNQYTRKWERQTTYGGKLFENIVQATARDVLALGMLCAEANGFAVLLTVHDEVIAESKDKTGDELAEMLSVVPPWAAGLPLAAKGSTMDRYRKD